MKNFTTIDGNKIIVNMEQVEYIDDDCVDGHICLNFMGDAPICVKGTLKSIMRWNQKQKKAKQTQTIAISQATWLNDDINSTGSQEFYGIELK